MKAFEMTEQLTRIRQIIGCSQDDVASQLEKEWHDFMLLVHNVSRVYEHVTGGQASKPLTTAEQIIALHDDHVTKLVEEALADAKSATK